jgi:hypothetical protein
MNTWLTNAMLSEIHESQLTEHEEQTMIDGQVHAIVSELLFIAYVSVVFYGVTGFAVGQLLEVVIYITYYVGEGSEFHPFANIEKASTVIKN